MFILSTLNLRRERFRALRQELGISQRDISIDLDISESHYRNIESGRGNPNAELLFRLSNYFDVTAEFLFPDLSKANTKKVK